MRTHDRPYKCDRPKCDFSQMGFGSQTRLNVHLQYHVKQEKSHMAHIGDIDDKIDDSQDVELIVFDAVKTKNLDLVRDFIGDIANFVPNVRTNLLAEAAESSSCEVLEVLLEACNSNHHVESDLLPYAVKRDNLETARMLLDRGASVDSKLSSDPCMDLAMTNRSPEMIKILLPHGPVSKSGTVMFPIQNFLSAMIRFNADILEEAKAIQCLGLLRGRTTEEFAFERCFKRNSMQCCSIDIAKFLLRHGVDVNTEYGGGTALYWASNRNTRRAAELMRFLLESGADPQITPPGKRPIAKRLGPRNVSKWFGISWDQLVEESREKYEASLTSKPS